MPTRTFTLFLSKERVLENLELLSRSAQDKIDRQEVIVATGGHLGDDSAAYVFRNAPREPQWVSDVRQSFNLPGNVRTQSASAVVIFRTDGRLFAVTFGAGWLYIEPSSIVNDFGLRVALNASSDTHVRRLDISNLGDAIRGVTQSASQRRFESFGVDEALELVRKINGTARDQDFGGAVTGSNSLKVSRDMRLSDIPELASTALRYYHSTNYRNTSFRIIDNISPIVDSDVIERLDTSMAESIRNGSMDFELGLPEVTENDLVSFRFVNGPRHRTFQDLQLQHYRTFLGDRLVEIDAEGLKESAIVAKHLDNQIPDRRMRVYDGLIGSTSLDGERYAINEGSWYHVDAQFRQSVDSAFHDAVAPFEAHPPVIRTIISEGGRFHSFESEEDYNERYANDFGYLNMDQKLIDIPEIQRSHFEVCDLIDIAGRRLIHVKMSGRRSSVLSHLFKQGKNSARMLRSVGSVWQTTVERVRRDFGQVRAEQLSEAVEDHTRPWSIEFHIADTPRPDGTFNIPFFSRVTFRDECRDIRSMGYLVAVRFIRRPDVGFR